MPKPALKFSAADETQRYAGQRQKMVETQLLDRQIKDFRLLDAMNRVPRHLFVPDFLQHKAYGEHPLPIGEDQTISQPYAVGLALASLRLTEKDKVLEIGTGSGYQTAVLAEMAGQVFTIERLKSLGHRARAVLEGLHYRNIVFKIFDGAYGWRDQAPFDAIVISAAVKEIPKPLIEQLGEGGRLTAPVGGPERQQLVRLTVCAGEIQREEMGDCRFVPLTGKFG